MDDSLLDSVFDDGASSDFEPVKPVKAVKAVKTKAAPKKATTAAKPRGRPAKTMVQTTLKTTKAGASKKRAKAKSDEENSDVDMDDGLGSDHDDSLLSNTPPNSKKQKKAPGPKKSSGKPLAVIDNEAFELDGTDEPEPAPKPQSKAAGTATERFQKVRPTRIISWLEPHTNFLTAYTA